MKTYKATYIEQITTEDSYKDGEIGQGSSLMIATNIQASSFAGLVKKVIEEMLTDATDKELAEVSIWIPEGENRFCFDRLEVAGKAGTRKPTTYERRRWREGKLKAYNVNYDVSLTIEEELMLTKEDLEGVKCHN